MTRKWVIYGFYHICTFRSKFAIFLGKTGQNIVKTSVFFYVASRQNSNYMPFPSKLHLYANFGQN